MCNLHILSNQYRYMYLLCIVCWHVELVLMLSSQRSSPANPGTVIKKIIFFFGRLFFSWDFHFRYIHGTLFRDWWISSNIIPTWEFFARTWLFCVFHFANLYENKVLANKKCFTVVSYSVLLWFFVVMLDFMSLAKLCAVLFLSMQMYRLLSSGDQ